MPGALSVVARRALHCKALPNARQVGESPTGYRNRWAARGGPHVPGCYLFMCGVLDPAGTTGRLAPKKTLNNNCAI